MKGVEVVELARRVAEESLKPRAAEHDRTGNFPVENFRDLGRSGLLGVYVPTEYGGLGASHYDFVRVVETLGAACASTAMMYVMHHNQYIMLVEHGSKQQRDFFLPNIARGECLVGSATTEPGTGGNADHCVSARRRDGDSFVINATKPVVSGSRYVDWVFLTTRESETAPSNSLSMMIVPGVKGEGVAPFGVWDCIGMRATASSGLKYEGCRVPAWHQIGGDVSDLPRATSMAPVAAVGFSAVWLGIARAAYEVTVSHLTQRTHQFIRADRSDVQQTLAQYDSVQRQVAEMRTKVEAARALIQAAARRMDELKPGPQAHIPIEKMPELQDLLWSARITASEAAVDVCRVGLRVCGVSGLRAGLLPLERHMRDALTSQVMAPAEDLTKLLLGRKSLGVPLR
ncbi:MAG: acyl-CoA dehydrogenase family protein [Hyalangium sp.]|uniref:acyl-CoA dehydrogenase family protein n=1 Tax=Hyalangium sp. TaxID=2028555 RepID=UPI003899900B